MTVLLGINGFGPIGRSVFYASLYDPNVSIVAINDTGATTEYIAFLMEHEVPPQHQIPVKAVAANENTIMVNGVHRIEVTHFHECSEIKWSNSLVSVVLECSGLLSTRKRSWGHIVGGAGAVVIASQSADAPLVINGINDSIIDKAMPVICAGHIVTGAIAPVIDLFSKSIGLEEVSFTSITSPQAVEPAAGRTNDPLEWRQARLASSSVVAPHRDPGISTLLKAFPQIGGRITGSSFQIPARTGCTVDLTLRTSKAMSKEQLDQFMMNAAAHKVYGLTLEHRPQEVAYISSDTVGTHKILYDQSSSQTTENGLTHKLILWVNLENNLAYRLLSLAKQAAGCLANRSEPEQRKSGNAE